MAVRYRVELTAAALRGLAACNANMRRRIDARILALAEEPRRPARAGSKGRTSSASGSETTGCSTGP